jgi:hypothetical protein
MGYPVVSILPSTDVNWHDLRLDRPFIGLISSYFITSEG